MLNVQASDIILVQSRYYQKEELIFQIQVPHLIRPPKKVIGAYWRDPLLGFLYN